MHPAQIKAALAIAGYSQVKLAQELGLSGNTVGAIIHGRSRSAQIEARIAEITRLPPEALWPQWYGEKPLVLTGQERELVLAYRAASQNAQRRALRALGANASDDEAGHHVRADRGGIATVGDVNIGGSVTSGPHGQGTRRRK